MLLHLVDVTGEDPVAAWKTLRAELAAYGAELAKKPEIIALSKVDASPEDYAEDVAGALRAAGAGEITTLSSVSGAGVRPLLRQLVKQIDLAREAEAPVREPEPWSP